jgi:hypothetical protein
LKFSLYLELATRAQAREEVLQLLRFPPESWFRQGNWRATAWKNGRYFSKRAKTREAILRHIGPTLNELRLWFLSENSDLETLRISSILVESRSNIPDLVTGRDFRRLGTKKAKRGKNFSQQTVVDREPGISATLPFCTGMFGVID